MQESKQITSNRAARHLINETCCTVVEPKRQARTNKELYRKEKEKKTHKCYGRIIKYLDRHAKIIPQRDQLIQFASRKMGLHASRMLLTYLNVKNYQAYNNLKSINKFAERLNDDGTFSGNYEIEKLRYYALINAYIASLDATTKARYKSISMVAKEMGYSTSITLNRYLHQESLPWETLEEIHNFAKGLQHIKVDNFNQPLTDGAYIEHSVVGAYSLAQPYTGSLLQPEPDSSFSAGPIGPWQDSTMAWEQPQGAFFDPTGATPALQWTPSISTDMLPKATLPLSCSFTKMVCVFRKRRGHDAAQPYGLNFRQLQPQAAAPWPRLQHASSL